MKVQRVFVEKRQGFDIEARRLLSDLADFLGEQYPELAKLRGLRILNRYDVSGLDEAQFEEAVQAVFSEPQCDRVFYGNGGNAPAEAGDCMRGVQSTPRQIPYQNNNHKVVDLCFAIEYLPGQYNQRADSAEQCVELVTGVKSLIRSAVAYILTPGDIPISPAALEAVKKYLINPVDSREASAELPLTLEEAETNPDDVPILTGFITSNDTELNAMARKYGLAMSIEDLRFCREWFCSIKRDPTLAELRVLDTYWSDHCRHTTFNTVLEKIAVGDGTSAAALQNALALYESAREELQTSKPRSLWDMATIGAKVIRKRGLADDVDVSKEINACTVKVNAEFGDGSTEPWLLLFKNETHNHPTEIEPFGGAATCLGGAIRDPLSGRAFVHQAMRVTGGGDPRAPLGETMAGKLPQIKIAREAAAGYSSYGNQIGLATGQVAEFYHSGFLAKRMELGAVVAAVPAALVRREEPESGDVVILVGGKTGRDGIGGATGSSKVHTGESVEIAGAEVQKGNAVEERKLQRLFRNPQAIRLIKRCNDFGAGGVSVAVGELATGLDIDLDKVPKKYAGLDGIELAISESQERMAVVCAAADADAFIKLAAVENLDAVVIAAVTANDNDVDNAALKMKWRGKTIVDLARSFLNTNGAPRSAEAVMGSREWGVGNGDQWTGRCGVSPQGRGAEDRHRRAGARGGAPPPYSPSSLLDDLVQELNSLRSGSRRGLQERFDGSIGAASVLFPWGGAEQATPECGMAALLPSLEKQSTTASLLTFGYDPELMTHNPYEGAKGSIREALAKFVCLGGDFRTARLSLQEYFERPVSPESWGKPAAALLGALEAQLELGIPAIGGKDSMSGNYCDAVRGIDITVPPTLVAFAAGTAPAASIRSGALSGKADNVVVLLAHNGWDSFKANMDALAELGKTNCVYSAYPVAAGGVATSLALMAFGNNTGLEAKPRTFVLATGHEYQGSVLAEIDGTAFRENHQISTILEKAGCCEVAAVSIEEPVFRVTEETADESSVGELHVAEISLAELRRAYEYPLAKVYSQVGNGEWEVGSRDSEIENGEQRTGRCGVSPLRGGAEARRAGAGGETSPLFFHSPLPSPHSRSSPLVVLPVFPGTNCEWDMERAFREAGARTKLVVFRNRSREDIAESKRELAAAISEAQILALSGGFSAGDEPDGSGKFIANVLRSGFIADAVNELLENRDGLILGICNGFQALIKLGLVPYGAYRKPDAAMPTLTFNRIGRHVSRMVRTRVMENCSPWLALEEPGTVHVVPVSHGEGRLVVSTEEGEALFNNGQVPFCYTDANGQPALREPDNPNGSDFAIEGLCSPDGRILGKMGHSERRGEYVHVNIPGNKRQRIFEAGVCYFL